MSVELTSRWSFSIAVRERSGTSLAHTLRQIHGRYIDQTPARSRGGKMIKQVLKVAAMLMLIAGLTAASAAIANGQSAKRLVVQVPFDFNVGDKAVLAGQYDVIIPSNTGDALSVRNHAGKGQAMILGRSAERRGGQMIAKLVFHRYGSTYFLAQAWMSGDST